jgi:dihydrofolate synthase/folylpolyglutamate synthase
MSDDFERRLYDFLMRNGVRYGITRSLLIDEKLGHPSKGFPTIHVTGTNGKGTVSTKVANGLQAQGMKVGLFTSPHVNTFRERIQINGKMISEEELMEKAKVIKEICSEAIFFEVLTAAAFLYFFEQKVDIAVIEVGIGGLRDCTNIISPLLSIITTISYDHMDVLGNTLDEIAREKAGIIKQNTPVVLGHTAARKPVFQQAFQCKSPIYLVPPIEDWMEENTEIARRALKILCKNADLTTLPGVQLCRFQIVRHGKIAAIYDIAHNSDGMEKLFKMVEKWYPGESYSVIFGLKKTKDFDAITQFLKSKTDHIFPYDGGDERLVSKEKIAKEVDVDPEKTITEFFSEVEERKSVLIVTGSAMIMRSVKEELTTLIPDLLPLG